MFKILTWVRGPLGWNLGRCQSVLHDLQTNDRIRCLSTSSEAPVTDPLGGIRVIDLTRIVAGPFCTMVLGDLGAEVLKIEKPGEGDECRKWGPPFIANSPVSCYFVSVNRNKKSICIDLKSHEGKQVLFDLAKTSDVLVENYVPGKMDEMGLGYDDFRAVAPHLVYCSVTGFGSEGPYRERPGYDVIAASIGGLLHITGPRDGEPCKVGVAMTDIMTGLYAHGAIMAALLQRAHTGRGQKIDTNLLSTQLSCLINIGSNYLNAGQEANRHGTSHPSIVPYEALLTKDGKYITVGAGSDVQFAALCSRFGLSELKDDKRFGSNEQRVVNRDYLMSILKEKFRSKSSKEWLQILEGAQFPYGPVNNLAEEVPAVRLKLRKPKSDKKVQWDSDTVDNEHMNKRRSKCCCIYKKPRAFGESSSSESEDECENCYGHKKKVLHKSDGSQSPSAPVPCGSGSVPSHHTPDLPEDGPHMATSSSRKEVQNQNSKGGGVIAAGRERPKTQVKINDPQKRIKGNAPRQDVKRTNLNRKRHTLPRMRTSVYNRGSSQRICSVRPLQIKKKKCTHSEVTSLTIGREREVLQSQNMGTHLSGVSSELKLISISDEESQGPEVISRIVNSSIAVDTQGVNAPPTSKKKLRELMCVTL